MICTSCEQQNPPAARFCMGCGSALARACGSCGGELPAEARFCPGCGAAVDSDAAATSEPVERSPRDYTPRHLADKILSSKSALEGERKQVTVLFADVQRSMELAEELDPEEWHRILDRFFSILSEGVHRFEGTINQYTGDGIMALFGAPIAHEDHAHRACYSALHLRDATREYANEVRASHGIAFGVRFGLNSGDVVVGKIGDDLRMDYTAQGQVVGVAQRLEALTDPGRISVSEHTARLVEGYFELEDLGRVRVKGLSEPLGLHELEGVGPFRTRLDRSRARGLSTFVGRDDEMATLEAALENAKAGRARIVGVVADAGVGKSRLCSEFVERCQARDITVVEAHCPAHGRTIPLLPVLELLRGYFGVTESDPPRTTREKIAGRLLLLDRELESYLPLMWDLLRVPDPDRPVEDLDVEVRQKRIAEVVRRVVRIRSEREPGVILIDDLHWIDSASDAFVADLVEAIRGTRSLLVVNFRPEYRAEWMQRSDYQQLPLSVLGAEAIRALLADLLGSDPSVAELPAAIEARTAGNPFFTEEVVQTLIESGHLEGERGGFRLTSPVERVEIPDTVQAVLAARIDRLVELEKRVLQTAAVIDKNFQRPLLAQIAELPESELDDALRTLCDADFLYERSLYPVAEYAFKHPLTHEVAYLSQLSDRRRTLHASLARVLEGPDANASLLAHHWDEAGEAEPAVRWHRQAAEEMGFRAELETIHHWERICALLEELPETPENFSLAARARGQLLWMRLRHGLEPEKAETLFNEARDFAERAGDRAGLARALRSYATYRLYSGFPGSPSLGAEAVREADASGELGTRIAACWSAGAGYYFTEALQPALDYCSQGIELCGDDLDVGSELIGYSPWIFLRAVRVGVRAALGQLSQAAEDLDRALAPHGEKHQLIQAVCNAFGVYLHRSTGDRRAALAFGQRAADGYERLPATVAAEIWTYGALGMAQVQNEEWDEAVSSLERAVGRSMEIGTFVHQQPEFQTWKARALLGRGEPEQALACLEEAMELARRMELVRPFSDAHLTRAAIWRALEPDAHERIATEIDAAAAVLERIGARGIIPEIHEERAALCELRADAAGQRRELEEALRLYREMGAEPNAERIARSLA